MAVVAMLAILVASAAPTAAVADEVDVSVEAFSAVSTSIGFVPGPEEKEIIKTIVRCVIHNKPVLVCARDHVVSVLPAEARPLALCMLQGHPIDFCTVQEMVSHLPPETRAAAQCIAQGRRIDQCATAEVVRRLPKETQAIGACLIAKGTFEKCASDEVIRRLPSETREVATCIAQKPDTGTCVTQAAVNTVHHRSLDLINKLKADARSELGAPSPGRIRNIINVAEGIRDDDWAKVSFWGGVEVYKLAAKIVLSILLPGLGTAIAQAVDPIVDTVVHHRVDLAVNLIKAIKKRDQAQIGRLLVEFYLVAQVEMQCALFDVLPQGSGTDAVREATCGNIGKVIKMVGGASADAIRLGSKVIEDALHTVGIDPSGIFQRSRACGTNADYYKNHYVICLKHMAHLTLTDPKRAGEVEGAVWMQCRKHFEACKPKINVVTGGTSEMLNGICNPQRDAFRPKFHKLADGLKEAADLYVGSHLDELPAIASGRPCDERSVGTFVQKCATSINAQMPALNSGNWMNCGDPSWNLPRSDIHQAACRVAACGTSANPKFAACRRYADAAIRNSKLVHEWHCDPKLIGGPRWNASFADHLQFCIAAAPTAANFENSQRVRTTNQCRTKFMGCSNYAATAELIAKQAREARCDPKLISGPRWAANASEHLALCMQADSATMSRETSERMRIYNSCRVTAAMPKGTGALSVIASPAGDQFTLSGGGYPVNARVIIRVSGPAGKAHAITSYFSDPKGNFKATLTAAEVCNGAGQVIFTAEDQDRPASKPVEMTCK